MTPITLSPPADAAEIDVIDAGVERVVHAGGGAVALAGVLRASERVYEKGFPGIQTISLSVSGAT